MTNAKPELELKPGDVVQIDPSAHPKFAACFAIVTEVRHWGCVADVLVPASPTSAAAPIRLRTDDFVRIGESCWLTGASPDQIAEYRLRRANPTRGPK